MILDLSSLQGSKSKIIAPLGVGLADTENGGPAAGRIGSDRIQRPICADAAGVSLAHITGLEQVFV